MASKRLQNFNSAEDGEESVDMSPMIDMVFLLLIFFIVNSNMIVVSQDKEVEVPIALDADKPETKNGRIVVNIYEDGTLKSVGGMEFESELDLTDYIIREKERIEGFGYKPMLHLRGDRRAVFRYCRNVIRSSASAGVDNFKFATYSDKNKWK